MKPLTQTINISAECIKNSTRKSDKDCMIAKGMQDALGDPEARVISICDVEDLNHDAMPNGAYDYAVFTDRQPPGYFLLPQDVCQKIGDFDDGIDPDPFSFVFDWQEVPISEEEEDDDYE